MHATREHRYDGRRIFDGRLRDVWRGFIVLRRVLIGVAVVHFSLAAASGFRAVRQVYTVNIALGLNAGAPGSVVIARFVASGRVHNPVRIELVQGSHVETLAQSELPENRSFFYDPRPLRAELRATISKEVLNRFEPGGAIIRAVAEGRSQFFNVPSPKVRELAITLVK